MKRKHRRLYKEKSGDNVAVPTPVDAISGEMQVPNPAIMDNTIIEADEVQTLTTFYQQNCPPEKVTEGMLVALAFDDGIYYGEVIDEPYSTKDGVEKAKIKFYKEKDSEFCFREKPN